MATPQQAGVSDYVILGGGSAGCVMAARLSEDPQRSVTLLEAGPWDRNPWIHIPMGFARLYVTQKYDWNYQTEAEAALGGRQMYWPRGRVIGGSGSVNGLVFLRGSPRDYDRWSQHGARGWGYDDCLPYFKKMETFNGPASEFRGTDGPMQVAEVPEPSEGCKAFVASCMALGYARNLDNNGDWFEGVAPNQLNVHRGRRWSPAVAYLKPAMGRGNLNVQTERVGVRIVFEDGRAVGVVVRRGPKGPEEFWRARKEVILCAGAIESPKMLMLSGIGPGLALQDLGIPMVKHAPEVGQNLQDHFMVRFAFRTRPCGTLNEMMASPIKAAKLGAEWLFTRKGQMAVGASEASLFPRLLPGSEEPEVQFQFVNFSLAGTQGVAAQSLAKYPGFTFNFCVCRPDSRGELTLRSPAVEDKPVLRPNYLSAPSDMHLMLESAKLGRKIAETPPFRNLIEEEIWPGARIQSEEEMMAYIRAVGSTVYHPCGTNRMGADERSVVDTNLKVRGVEGLRVVDASVFPLVPSSNIHPAVLMLAEKAADMVKRAA